MTAVILKILHFFTNRPFALLFTSMMANQPWRYSISVHVDSFELCVLQSAFLSQSTFYPGLQPIVCFRLTIFRLISSKVKVHIGHQRVFDYTVIAMALSYSIRRRVSARNVSFQISLRSLIHIINSVDRTKLSCNTPTDATPQFLWKLTPFFHKIATE